MISKTDLRSKHCRASATHFFSHAQKLVTNAVSRSKPLFSVTHFNLQKIPTWLLAAPSRPVCTSLAGVSLNTSLGQNSEMEDTELRLDSLLALLNRLNI